MELYVIAAAVIGGTALAGGSGSILGSVLGALIMQSLDSGMLLLDVAIGKRMVIIGQVLIVAVVFDVLYRRRFGEQLMATVDASRPLVELRDIRKAFGGVHAVDGVSVNLYAGEVVALLGHNGAGKSTLMKMLAGAYPIDSGDIADRRREGPHPHAGRRAGARHRDDLPDAGAGRQPRRGRPTCSSAARSSRPGARSTTTSWRAQARKVFQPAEQELHQHPRAGARGCRAASGRWSRSRARSTSTRAS